MKQSLFVLMLILTSLNSCEIYLIKASEKHKEAMWYKEHNQTISELNTLEQMKWWYDKYITCKDKDTK